VGSGTGAVASLVFSTDLGGSDFRSRSRHRRRAGGPLDHSDGRHVVARLRDGECTSARQARLPRCLRASYRRARAGSTDHVVDVPAIPTLRVFAGLEANTPFDVELKVWLDAPELDLFTTFVGSPSPIITLPAGLRQTQIFERALSPSLLVPRNTRRRQAHQTREWRSLERERLPQHPLQLKRL
jgi:hypothetical protein